MAKDPMNLPKPKKKAKAKKKAEVTNKKLGPWREFYSRMPKICKKCSVPSYTVYSSNTCPTPICLNCKKKVEAEYVKMTTTRKKEPVVAPDSP